MWVVAAGFLVSDNTIAASVVAALAAFTIADDTVAIVTSTADVLGTALRSLMLLIQTTSAVMPSGGASATSLTTVEAWFEISSKSMVAVLSLPILLE